jgi:hypothetical protein
MNKVMDSEINQLFKYLQSLSHIWDLHEIGLIKKERSLQELLQDCRKDHDNENQVILKLNKKNLQLKYKIYNFRF